MHIPLIIAIIALLAWTMLPQLDHFMQSEPKTEGLQAYLSRLAHWVNE